MKIEEYLKTLTPEEIEKHKDLIEECLEREAKLGRLNIDGKLKELGEVENKLYNSLQELQTSAKELHDQISNLYQKTLTTKKESVTLTEQIGEAQIRAMKKEDFYKA